MIDFKKEEIRETTQMLRKRLEQLQDDVPELTDDYHRLFLYFIGDQFENLPPSKIKICDRKLDQKIDFYHAGEDRFVAYQCKLPEFELLEEEGQIRSFGADLVNELEDILTFLTDDSGIATGNEQAQEARNQYRARKNLSEEAGSAYKLEVALAFFGKLTPPAREKLLELKTVWGANGDTEEEPELEITVIDFDRIETELSLSSIAKDRPQRVKFYYQSDTQVHTNQWGYALIPAMQFYDLFEQYRMSLFDLNVRYYLKRSSINKEIIKTLSTSKGQKNFHLLNNGVTISCSGWHFSKPDQNWFTLTEPQIINGCQTLISIYRAYSQMRDENLRRNFVDRCLVPVRIIRINSKEQDLLADVVTASNNQNKMSPRNLRSNDRIQRVLHRKFDQLAYRWFYERKDEEFNSSKQFSKNFTPKHYQYSSNSSRVVSNEDIAKSWLSFIGLSKDASERINAFDFDDDGERYEWLFGRRPSDEHWDLITLGPQVKLSEDNFEPFSPAPEQYLLSYLIFQFVNAYLPTPYANRKQCEERLVKSGKIDHNSPDEVKKTAMVDDHEYVLNQVLYNMKGVIVELYAWILAKVYGPLNEATARKILQLPGFSDLYQKPDFKGYARELESSNSPEKQGNLLFTCFEFVKEAVIRWKSVNENQYLSAPRRIRFLHSVKTVETMKYYLDKTNTETIHIAYQWKPPGKTFLESLPKLKS
ncbi:MAG: AIPR family protein [Anaerolineae bacterium]|nr:AIPR family protein [Anaerolineae bacterium]